jgi:tetratricopeptide (TPR) repeat protein
MKKHNKRQYRLNENIQNFPPSIITKTNENQEDNYRGLKFLWYNYNLSSYNRYLDNIIYNFREKNVIIKNQDEPLSSLIQNGFSYILIISGSECRPLIRHLIQYKEIIGICLFCADAEDHRKWSAFYPKIISVENLENSFPALCNFIQLRYQQKLSPMYMVNYKKIVQSGFFKLDGIQDYIKYIYINTVIHLIQGKTNSEKNYAKEDFKTYANKYIENNYFTLIEKEHEKRILQLFMDFSDLNVDRDFISWYTRESFIYKMVNKSFREGNFLSIFYLRYFIKNLCTEINDIKNGYVPEYVYRATLMSKNELEKWRNLTVPIPILLNGFISTTSSLKVAKEFHNYRKNIDEDLIEVIFRIKTVPEKVKSIERYSSFLLEKEYLINLNSFIKFKAIPGRYDIDNLIIDCEFSNLEEIQFSIPEITKSHQRYIESMLKKDYEIEDFYLAEFFIELQKPEFTITLLSNTSKLIPDDDKKSQAILKSFLGQAYYQQGKYELAIKEYKESIKIKKVMLGLFHTEVATCYNNLAVIFDQQGDYSSALNYYRKTLIITKENYGANHPEIAIIYNNMGNISQKEGNLEKSLRLYENALKIKKNRAEDKDSVSATLYNNLALIHSLEGKYIEAAGFYEQALDIKMLTLGKDHPDTAVILNNLASMYSKQGKHEKAVEYYKRSLHIYKKTYGKIHHMIASTYNNLATCHFNSETYNNLATCHFNSDNFEIASKYYRKAFAIMEQTLGKNHMDTLSICNNLAVIYRKKGDYSNSIIYYEKLAEYLSLNDKNHDKNLKPLLIYNNLAYAYNELGDIPKVIKCYETIIDKKYGGEFSPFMEKVYNKLADIYCNEGNFHLYNKYKKKAIEIGEILENK